MKTMLLVLALALSLVGGCGRGGGDSAEKVFADMTSNMQEMSAILATRQRLEARPELMAILGPALQGMENDL